MATALLYLYFAASVTLAVTGGIYLLRVFRGIAVLGANGTPLPTWLHVFILSFGCFGILAAAPLIFSDNPTWFVDKFFFVVERTLAAFI
jgi:hypothetical protein